jgi:hypothetical protein
MAYLEKAVGMEVGRMEDRAMESKKIKIDEGQKGVKVIDSDIGERFDSIEQRASKIVLGEKGVKAVIYNFRDQKFVVTEEQAKKVFSPENILGRINNYKSEIDNLNDRVKTLNEKVNAELRFGKKVYGKGFSLPKQNK